MFYKNSVKAVLLAIPFFLISACGGKGKLELTAVDVSTSQVNQKTYLNFVANVKIGKLRFPNIEVPILNPATMTSFGQLALARLSDGTNKLYVSVDFETASHLDPSLGYSLPNGREIPLILGSQNTALIGIPVLQNSRIYVGGDIKKDLFIGAAISIPAFDNILNQVAIPLNIFTGFPFSPTVTGVAGLFTSPGPGQNGLALFVKKSANAPAAAMLAVGRETTSQTSVADGNIPTEMSELDNSTLHRLNHFMNRSLVLKVK